MTAVRKHSLEVEEARFGWKLILPAVIIVGGLILYPIVYNMILSFYDVNFRGRDTFVGTENYRKILNDSTFWRAVLTTVTYVAFTTAGTTLVGLAVALVMNQKFPLRSIVRALVLLPYVAPVISVVYAWQFFFDPVNGIFMYATVDVLGIFKERFNLIGSPRTAIVVAIVFNI